MEVYGLAMSAKIRFRTYFLYTLFFDVIYMSAELLVELVKGGRHVRN
jgi:hypothetical protein